MRLRSPVIKEGIIKYLQSYIDENGYAPSLREISSAVGIPSTSTVNSYIRDLVDEGLIKKTPGKSRTMDLVNHKRVSEFGFVEIPLLKGYKPGNAIFSDDNISGYITIPLESVGESNIFSIYAPDDSMAGMGIDGGDIVAFSNRKGHVDDGDIVAFLYADDIVIRRIEFINSGDDGVCLKSADPSRYADMEMTECNVLGVLETVIHYMGGFD